MNKLSIEEMEIGGMYGLCLIFWIGAWAIPVGISTSILWSLTGAGYSKLYRRLCCPVILAIAMVIHSHSLIPFISVPLQWGALSLGYGEIDVNDSTGSWLGRHFGKWTRVVWFGILAVAMIPLVIGG